jgi:nucleotide-binding universal stress UspA family protein
MTPQSVLVLLTQPPGARVLLDTALVAARALGGEPRIEVLHVRLDPVSTIIPSEEVLTAERVRAVEGAAATEGAKVYAVFEAWRAAGHDGPRHDGDRQDGHWQDGHWQEVVGVPADEVCRRGPAAALVALTLPAPHPPSAEQAALMAALFDGGRPVLVVPAGWRGGFGRHLAVGWRDSPTTRKALTALRPWLAAAETVTVLMVTDASPPPPDGPLAGLPGRVVLRTVAPGDAGDGAALLAAAVDAGADGLAMGAYRHGRMLQWMLDGVTEHVLHHAVMPLLMMH